MLGRNRASNLGFRAEGFPSSGLSICHLGPESREKPLWMFMGSHNYSGYKNLTQGFTQLWLQAPFLKRTVELPPLRSGISRASDLGLLWLRAEGLRFRAGYTDMSTFPVPKAPSSYNSRLGTK